MKRNIGLSKSNCMLDLGRFQFGYLAISILTSADNIDVIKAMDEWSSGQPPTKGCTTKIRLSHSRTFEQGSLSECTEPTDIRRKDQLQSGYRVSSSKHLSFVPIHMTFGPSGSTLACRKFLIIRDDRYASRLHHFAVKTAKQNL